MTTTPRLAPEWTPPERPASETREQLLAAAERLFAERGFGGVSVRPRRSGLRRSRQRAPASAPARRRPKPRSGRGQTQV